MRANLLDASPTESQIFDPHAALRPLRWALTVRQTIRWTLYGAGIGAGVGTLLLLVRHFVVFAAAPRLAFAAILAGAVVGLVVSLIRRPSLQQAARVADSRFSLKDRITTALELTESRDPLAVLQRKDVARRVEGLQLRDAARGSVARRELVMGFLAVAVFMLALVVPAASRSADTHTHRAATVLPAARHSALVTLRGVRRTLVSGMTPTQRNSAGTRQALSALSRLKAELKHAVTQEEALRDISTTQDQLRRAATSVHPIPQQAAARLASSMHRYLTHRDQVQAGKGGSHLTKVVSHMLSNLGASARKMTVAQKRRVAQALQAAANSQPNGQLKSDLSKAASALGHNDARTASQALQHMSQALAASPTSTGLKSKLSHASKQLDSVKNNINRLKHPQQAPNSPGNATTSSGASYQPQGGKDQSGSGSTSGKVGKPTAGSGKRTRTTRATGPALGRKLGGGSTRAGQASGKANAVVYVPGLATKGQHLLPIVVRAAPKPVPVVPYRQVIAQYGRSARTSLERSPLPPGLRDYVRKYFTTLAK